MDSPGGLMHPELDLPLLQDIIRGEIVVFVFGTGRSMTAWLASWRPILSQFRYSISGRKFIIGKGELRLVYMDSPRHVDQLRGMNIAEIRTHDSVDWEVFDKLQFLYTERGVRRG